MGLFGDFFRAVGRTVGRVVETVGDAIGSTTISDLGWKIQDACAERVASEKSYDKKEANIYTTERLNEILVSFSEGYLQNATLLEKECIRLVEEYYDKLIGVIESAPGGTYSAANLKALKNGKGRIPKTISGGIREPLAKRMSLDDTECLGILKMDAGVGYDRKASVCSSELSKYTPDTISVLCFLAGRKLTAISTAGMTSRTTIMAGRHSILFISKFICLIWFIDVSP